MHSTWSVRATRRLGILSRELASRARYQRELGINRGHGARGLTGWALGENAVHLKGEERRRSSPPTRLSSSLHFGWIRILGG